MQARDREYARHLVGWTLATVASVAAVGLSATSAPGDPLAPLTPWVPNLARLLYGLVSIDIVLCALRCRSCW